MIVARFLTTRGSFSEKSDLDLRLVVSGTVVGMAHIVHARLLDSLCRLPRAVAVTQFHRRKKRKSERREKQGKCSL